MLYISTCQENVGMQRGANAKPIKPSHKTAPPQDQRSVTRPQHQTLIRCASRVESVSTYLIHVILVVNGDGQLPSGVVVAKQHLCDGLSAKEALLM